MNASIVINYILKVPLLLVRKNVPVDIEDSSSVSSSCIRCEVPNCDKCPEKSRCTECKTSLFLHTKDDITTTCEVICPTGYRGDISSTPYSCILCDASNCEVCDSSGDCMECKEGLYLNTVNNVTNCEENCPVGFGTDKSLRPYSCTACIANNCKRCGSYDMCYECEDGYYLIFIDDIYTCVDTCPSGYNALEDISIKTCGKCEVSNCEICNELNECDRCKEGYYILNINGTVSCESNCGEGYKSDDLSRTCLKIKTNNSGETQDQSESNQEEKEEITQTQIERGQIIASANTYTTSIISASTAASSILSKNPGTLVFYLNTIQILSYIQYLSINLPFEVKQDQKSSYKFMKRMNILSNLNIAGKDPKDYLSDILEDPQGFIPQIIYQLITLSLIIIFHSFLYLIIIYDKGKVKDKASKLIKVFRYGVYLQYFLMSYMDFTQSAVSKIVKVSYI